MTGDAINLLLGGLGLFLLGMLLMTDGLRVAAGPALSGILSGSTQTPGRGLASGILVTALVQSSSAVTVATIGFVNAGLLTFAQSLWVIFGANVGTTMTGWLVALIGFKVKIEALALPLIGIGMALRLTGAESRRGAAGTAVAGFGLLFLGISFLQQAFTGADALNLAVLSGRGVLSVLAFVLAGLLLTVLMQSSSAALAVVLTLAQTGVLPLQEAAAAVIGANVGTTVTALLATIGATPNARRAAAAHVMFNVLTAVAALLLLPLLIGFVDLLRDVFDMDQSPAVSLALFHSLFNVLGVLLMWPLAERLAALLLRRFRTREEEIGQPQFLDRNVAAVPSLAVSALNRELLRFGGIASAAARSRIARLLGGEAAVDDLAALPTLDRNISAFVASVNRSAMSAATAEAMARLLRVQRYYETCGEQAAEVAAAQHAMQTLADPLRALTVALAASADRLLSQTDPSNKAFTPLSAEQTAAFEADYQQVKASLLAAGAAGELDIETMESLLRAFSALRRILDQSAKAARLLQYGVSGDVAQREEATL